MAEELSSIEMLKADFVSSVSHELKTPLSQISNYATILQSESLSESDQREYIERIGDSARRLSVLVTNILQLNRLENQKIQTQKEKVNLSEQLSGCILNVDSLLEEKEIQLTFSVDEDIWIFTDVQLMEIVWNNLISNAIKFVDTYGEISICGKQKGDMIEISVQDNGCGMNEQTAKHVFDKFYQADTSRKTAGNGIGLALVRRIVDLLQYDIKVETKEGSGSNFIVCIPVE